MRDVGVVWRRWPHRQVQRLPLDRRRRFHLKTSCNARGGLGKVVWMLLD